jgi:hypothetical protein
MDFREWLGGVGARRWACMTQQMVWKCEQWIGGRIKEQNVFPSEEQAREFARRVADMSPDLLFKIEPMPIQHVWN